MLQSDLNISVTAQRATAPTVNLFSEAVTKTDVVFDLGSRQDLSAAAGVTGKVVSLGSLATVKTLLLISDQAVTVHINGEATGHVCKTLLLTDAVITALTVDNAGSVAANVTVIMLGS